jgi:glycerophosphoryl diester phosphodiesterase
VLQIPVEKLGFRFDLERIVTSAHEHNLAVQYWTVNDEEEMHSLIKLGIDGIMTDKHTTLKKILEEYK